MVVAQSVSYTIKEVIVMKKSAAVSKKAPVINANPAPGIFIYDGEGNKCGIVNLHVAVKESWDSIDGEYFAKFESKLGFDIREKGTIIFRMNNAGRKITLGWLNGSEEGKSMFIQKLGKEDLFFNRALSADDINAD